MSGVATRDQVLGVVREAIVMVMEIDPAGITDATRLVEDLSADSLALVEIVELTEERLVSLTGLSTFHIDDDDIESLVTVGDAVDYALGRL